MCILVVQILLVVLLPTQRVSSNLFVLLSFSLKRTEIESYTPLDDDGYPPDSLITCQS